jgi:hypothetical protein
MIKDREREAIKRLEGIFTIKVKKRTEWKRIIRKSSDGELL